MSRAPPLVGDVGVVHIAECRLIKVSNHCHEGLVPLGCKGVEAGWILGKIERWHRSLKSQILLENYYLPGELEARIDAFVDYYNNERYHESLNNLTPSDVYYGRGESILARREQIKLNTMAMRRKMHERNRVESLTLMS